MIDYILRLRRRAWSHRAHVIFLLFDEAVTIQSLRLCWKDFHICIPVQIYKRFSYILLSMSEQLTIMRYNT